MKFAMAAGCGVSLLGMGACALVQAGQPEKPVISVITPPEKAFFSKELSFHGIPIKAHLVVSDKAL